MDTFNNKLFLSNTLRRLIYEIESLIDTTRQHPELKFKANAGEMRENVVKLKMLYDELDAITDEDTPEMRGIAFLARVVANKMLDGTKRQEYEDKFIKLMNNYSRHE